MLSAVYKLALVTAAFVLFPGAHAAGPGNGKQAASKHASAGTSAAASAPADPVAQWGPLGFHATWVHPYQGSLKTRAKQPAVTTGKKVRPAAK